MDVCDYCETEHPFDLDLGDTLYIFLDSYCHHVRTTCPSCGMVSRIFTGPSEVMQIMQEGNCHARVFPETPDSVRDGYKNAHAQAADQQHELETLEHLFEL